MWMLEGVHTWIALVQQQKGTSAQGRPLCKRWEKKWRNKLTVNFFIVLCFWVNDSEWNDMKWTTQWLVPGVRGWARRGDSSKWMPHHPKTPPTTLHRCHQHLWRYGHHRKTCHEKSILHWHQRGKAPGKVGPTSPANLLGHYHPQCPPLPLTWRPQSVHWGPSQGSFAFAHPPEKDPPWHTFGPSSLNLRWICDRHLRTWWEQPRHPVGNWLHCNVESNGTPEALSRCNHNHSC